MAQKIIIVVMLCLVILAGVLVLVFSQGSCPSTNRCISVQECYDLHMEQSSLNSALLFTCSDKAGYVCCPGVAPSGAISTLISLDSKKDLLPNDCGFITGVRISEGQEAGLGQFPWMALLSFKLNGTRGEKAYLCGGTLITRKYILTAAHCMVTEHGVPLSIRLGELDLSTEEDCTDEYCSDPPLDIEVEKVIMHENYNKPFLKNDIALVRLKTAAPLTSYIIPICLPFNLNITGEEEEEKYLIAGWGKLEHSSHVGSNSLQFTRVSSVAVSECNDAVTQDVKPIGRLQLCAGGVRGHDACKGDSGGPMMKERLNDKGEVRTFQVGIISFGNIPCGKEVPSVYTRVNAYLNWILSHLEP